MNNYTFNLKEENLLAQFDAFIFTALNLETIDDEESNSILRATYEWVNENHYDEFKEILSKLEGHFKEKIITDMSFNLNWEQLRLNLYVNYEMEEDYD